MFKSNTLTLLPAYGRDYTSKERLVAAWNDDKDFQIATTGQYVNRQQTKQLLDKGIVELSFRYDKKRKQLLYRIALLD